ncbi:hypothetical protein TW85_21855 [Marinomonas sp. S3726]|uniref:hypothetical protein n=1 Tax=Marinomonas sp. S3726 TaxID=579484 RepID=UPI0005FA1946|nr:hypothetical protein [Marinomonas sp. S3726]KJZ09589.1 hypothetical protein TW85_21855 [Marinomonas sp. S3726]
MSVETAYEKRFKRERLRFSIFALLAIIAPVVALVIPIRPEEVSLDNWFARSGAAMVVLALLAESNAFKIFNLFNPSGMVEVGFDEFRRKYWGWPARLNKTAFILVAVGTLIWGYGDLLV